MYLPKNSEFYADFHSKKFGKSATIKTILKTIKKLYKIPNFLVRFIGLSDLELATNSAFF